MKKYFTLNQKSYLLKLSHLTIFLFYNISKNEKSIVPTGCHDTVKTNKDCRNGTVFTPPNNIGISDRRRNWIAVP